MSFITAGKRDKVCLSCGCWAGPRTVDSINSRARSEPADTKATCAAPSGPRRGALTGTSSSCNKWVAWAVLR